MKLYIAILLLICSSCCSRDRQAKILPLSDSELSRSKADLAHFNESTKDLIAEAKASLKELDTLSLSERKSLAALLIIMSDISALSPGDQKSTAYKAELAQMVNDYFAKAKVIDTLDKECLGYEIQYAAALAKCKAKGKDESKCPEAWAASVASINCAENRLKKRISSIRQVKDLIK
jgi:hypothetical protein